MKRFKIEIATSIAAFLLLGGCASVVNPDYQPHLTQQATAVHAQPVRITVQDLRAAGPTLLSTVRENVTGPYHVSEPMTMLVHIKQPLSDFIQSSLTKALSQTGYRVNHSSQRVLRLRVMNSSIHQDRGFITTKTFFTMQTQVALINRAASQTIWKTTLNVKGTASSDISVQYGKALNNAMDNLANQIIQSKALQK